MSPRIDVQVLQKVQRLDLLEQKRPEMIQEVHLLDRLEHLGPGKTQTGSVGAGEGRGSGLGEGLGRDRRELERGWEGLERGWRELERAVEG